MHGLIHEEYEVKKGIGADFMAYHLFSRMHHGKVVIVTRQPHTTISCIRKQWMKLIRRKLRERASTLDSELIQQLTETLASMQKLRFTLKYPPEEYSGDIHIARPDIVLQSPPSCQTMYVACGIERKDLHLITAWMPKDALIVVLKYEDK